MLAHYDALKSRRIQLGRWWQVAYTAGDREALAMLAREDYQILSQLADCLEWQAVIEAGRIVAGVGVE